MLAQDPSSWKVIPLAPDFVEVYRSADPDHISCYSPGLAVCPGGRIIATLDIGGKLTDTSDLFLRSGRSWQGKVYTSDDQGNTWMHRNNFPFMHARPFIADSSLYILGQAGDLMIIRSDDLGLTWTEPRRLTEGQYWHQAPCNVHYANGCIYMVMERRMTFDQTGWYVGEMAPVLMRGRTDADLTRRENWTFASTLSFRDIIPGIETDPELDWFGIPFFRAPYPAGSMVAPGRNCAPLGWLETNVVQFTDTNHIWADPSGRTFHLWMRAHTGGTGYACIARVTEAGNEPGTGPMLTTLEKAPSGKRMLYVPCPGGQMKFHVLYDEMTALYWLLSTQSTDGMRKPHTLPADRYNLPNNERRRLQLHFSRNMVDWCFAGFVVEGPADHASRHYASMIIDGDDLCILSRSGDMRAKSAHDGNMITFHRIPDFRRLVY
jgi:hypothetical protein